MNASRIITSYVCPPIPDRRFDWSARDDNYEPGCPIGWGRTEAEAIADYRDALIESTNVRDLFKALKQAREGRSA